MNVACQSVILCCIFSPTIEMNGKMLIVERTSGVLPMRSSNGEGLVVSVIAVVMFLVLWLDLACCLVLV